MMRKRLIAIALTACFTPIVAPQNTRAQVVESMVGGSACAASVGCGVIVGITVLAGRREAPRSTCTQVSVGMRGA